MILAATVSRLPKLHRTAFLGAVIGLLATAASAWAAPTLTVGSLSGNAGSTVNVPITFDPTTANVAGIQFNLTLPAGLSTGTITAGSIVTNAGKSVSSNFNGTTWTFIIFGLNQTTISSGNLLTIQIQIAGSASGALSIPISAVSYTDPNGAVITPGTNTGGTITVPSAPPPPPPPPPPPSAPVISSAGNATGTVGIAFSYQITASNSPTSFNATGLPSGLAINTASGLISGTPTAASTSTITLSATNAGGTGNKTLTLVISAPVVTAPTLSGGSVTGAAGTSVNLPLTFNTGTALVAGIQFNLTLPAGLSSGTVTPGTLVTNAGKSVSANLNGTTWTFLVFGLNQNTMSSGNLLTAQIPIALGTAAGTKTISITGASFTDANGLAIAGGTLTAGTITVTTPANSAPTVNAGTNQTITLPSSATLLGSANDDGLPNPPAHLTTTWSKLSGPGTVTFGNAANLSTTATFSSSGTYVLRLTASDSVLSSTASTTITVNPALPPPNQAPTVNAGTDQIITLPASANLVGSANDDGLPNPPATLTTTWSKISGPGAVTFGNVNSLSTTAAFASSGTYVLQLRASDSILSATDTLTVTVNAGAPQNQAPSVNAGADQAIMLPASANLSGSALDDGLPNPPATLTTTWSKVSGPGTVTFGNTSNLSTTASFSQAGTYVLRLLASDSVLSSNDTLTVTVSSVAAPSNQAPVVNAGSDQAISLPSSVNLAGAAADDGLPNPPATLTTTWSKVSGPGTVNFGNASNMTTTASFSQAGSYVLRLTVSDSQLSSNDTVTITVSPAALPVALLSASPTSIAPGQSSTLTWLTVNANTMTIDHGIGAVSASGSISVSPSVTTTYMLTATGPGGSVTQTATITVQTVSSVLTPTLLLPAYLKLNDSVSAGYGADASNIQFVWTFTPNSNASAGAGSFSIISRAGGGSSTLQSAIGHQTASLATNPSLTAGPYLVTVHACDSSNHCSGESAAAPVTLVSADLSGIRVFPNPWRSDKHSGKPVTFDQLTLDTSIKIFTVSGHLVKSLPDSSSLVTWNLDNESGDKVASGIYVYLIKANGQKRTGQIVVIK